LTMDPIANETISCTECQAGQMHRRFITYFTWLGEELVTVPDFPAWVCDVCGQREFDVHAMNRLSLLLSENAGHPNPRQSHPVTKAAVDKRPRPARNRE
jgi:YgiT-type zinc finger domain-containing protein